MEESVIYQDILQKGERLGEQLGEARGRLQAARTIALRMIERRCGKPTTTVRWRIEQLTREQLEALCEATLDFRSKVDVTQWLKQHAAGVRQQA